MTKLSSTSLLRRLRTAALCVVALPLPLACTVDLFLDPEDGTTMAPSPSTTGRPSTTPGGMTTGTSAPGTTRPGVDPSTAADVMTSATTTPETATSTTSTTSTTNETAAQSTGGPDCMDLQDLELCGAQQSCVWQLGECIDDPCLAPSECGGLAFLDCQEVFACDWVGDVEVGECLANICVPCALQQIEVCMESPFCSYLVRTEMCVNV